ncbi:peptidyl-prolyl cis-trans isomerase cyp15 [Radiomyces spectabilis]|uniref:peptidyl-prolyl cis-trans isomerase cyp15 n=1 Tax=Radiomyces spectabilis TaxID=64574 RepID=UPI00221E3DDD|nr:peptidyl-prolyl cis-trans isomerase cyp15 [Radiomyces spectabilis]KAI8372788.1 peptidyl-prolyl cis-trans isomerase cyp15 [Radiomyces spectabilis]
MADEVDHQESVNNKRPIEEDASPRQDLSDDDIGPLMPPSETDLPRKKKRTLAYEKLYLANIPSADMYEKSYMHRDVLNQVAVTKSDFIITTSVDGHLKFWKKTSTGIEFVKHYRSHISNIVGISVSADNELLATISDDMALKVYDITNFDMINMVKLGYKPKAVCWIHQKDQAQALIAVSEAANSNIHIYDGRADGKPIHTFSDMHTQPVHIMTFNSRFNCVVSVDGLGMVEYWSPEEPFELPKHLDFELKSETDLYEFRKHKSVPTCLVFSPDESKFVTMSFPDRQVRLFRFSTGKIYRKYDESLHIASEMQQAGTTIYKLDDMEFGRRLAVDKELEKSPQSKFVNAVFDDSGNFIIYATLLGIKVVNIRTNKVVRLLGKSETHRFVNVSMYQGAPRKKGIYTMAMAASDNSVIKESETLDPTLFCTAFKRNRFFMFTRREPYDDDSHKADRDVFNEKPSREEQTVAATQERKQVLGTQAILRTTAGDIHLRLFPDVAPKAVENFVTHAKNGYYDNLIFHRVIKGFMIQTGCPFGDGTGGESIWGDDFEDEITREVRHDRPYTVSMANAGPNTNGSQFFITVVPTPWLDGKHTIFGRATAGMDVVHDIEHVKVDKSDKPYDDIKIINIEIR